MENVADENVETRPARRAVKPLGQKAYGSICHLPGSRLGPGDHKLNPGQARILTERPRDRHDVIVVQEKLDGSNVAVARVGGDLLPLTRAGYHARDSHFTQHHLFADWFLTSRDRFEFLAEGERVSGEWLAQAHGTRYRLPHEPFVAFDLIHGQRRAPFAEFQERVGGAGLTLPHVVSVGPPVSVEAAMKALASLPGGNGAHGSHDPVEGAVWRVERRGEVDYLGKYVRPDKVDGKFLSGIGGGGEDVWNWHPNPSRVWHAEEGDER